MGLRRVLVLHGAIRRSAQLGSAGMGEGGFADDAVGRVPHLRGHALGESEALQIWEGF